MPLPSDILLWTSRLTLAGTAALAVAAWWQGAGIPLGFVLAALVVLLDLTLLTGTVARVHRSIRAGGTGVAPMLALQVRSLGTLLSVLLLGSLFGMESVAGGVVLPYVALTLAALGLAAAAMAQASTPLESL